MSAIRNLTAIILILAVSSAFGQIAEEWVARYNGPGNDWDMANDLAVDAQGYVYVTGSSEGSGGTADYATIKYAADGTEIWVARYDGPGSGSDVANALAVDAEGYVYVTGSSDGDPGYPTNLDYGTIKYDPYGTQLWVHRYDGPGNGWDEAHDIAVDDSGYVYITGESRGTTTGSDYCTIKYKANGDTAWVRRGGGWAGRDDYAYALALDDSSNVFVTGAALNDTTFGYDYMTLKYSSSGRRILSSVYNRFGVNGWDGAVDIVVDDSSNFYVTGKSTGAGTGFDYATLKQMGYAPFTRRWVVHYDGPTSGEDVANALALDAQGNVYVTGGSDNIGTFPSDYLTIKYAPGSTELWTARYDGPANSGDEAHDLAVDAQGNVYVTGGSFDDTTEADYATIKYDSGGNRIWLARYNGPANWEDVGNALAVDGLGNVYVTGGSPDTATSCDYATIRYSPAPLLSCHIADWPVCQGKDVYFRVTCNNYKGSPINTTVTFSGYRGYNCPPPALVSIPRNRTIPIGTTTYHHYFKVPMGAAPGPYSISWEFVYAGTPYSCCMNLDIIRCVPWRTGTNTEWGFVEVDRPETELPLPTVASLAQNYPNPFNATTEVGYNLAEAGDVSLNVYDITGRLVETLVEGYQEVGEHEVTWDASQVSSGIYFYKLTTGDFTETKRMTLLK